MQYGREAKILVKVGSEIGVLDLETREFERTHMHGGLGSMTYAAEESVKRALHPTVTVQPIRSIELE